MAKRVVDQDPHDLRQPLRIARRIERTLGHSQPQLGVLLRRRRRELAGDHAAERADVGGLGAQLERSGLQAREVQQVGRQLAEPVDLPADLLDERAPRLVVELLVGEELEEPAQREDRRAQLVRRRRDEALACGVELRELDPHPFERHRELTELVGRVDREARGEVAARHAGGRGLQPPDAAAVRLGDAVAREQRGHERDRAGHQHPPPDERDVRLDVGERHREHGDLADALLVADRHRGLGEPPGVAGLVARCDLPRRRRIERDGELQVADLDLGGRVERGHRLQPGRRAVDDEQRDSRVRGVRRGADVAVEHLHVDGVDDVAAHLTDGVLRRHRQTAQPLVAQRRLQRRHDVHVDDGDHAQRDRAEQHGQPVGDGEHGPSPSWSHSIRRRRGTGSRRRGP